MTFRQNKGAFLQLPVKFSQSTQNYEVNEILQTKDDVRTQTYKYE